MLNERAAAVALSAENRLSKSAKVIPLVRRCPKYGQAVSGLLLVRRAGT